MNEIMLEVSAFCIALFCLVDSLKRRSRLYLPIPKTWNNKMTDQHFTYLILIGTLMISALSSFLEVALEEYVSEKSAFILNLLTELYFIFHTGLSLFVPLYILNMMTYHLLPYISFRILWQQ